MRPVEPPERLSQRLEQTLTDLTEMAAEELEAWELSAMRDPRNWARPVAAVAVGGVAGAAWSCCACARSTTSARRRARTRSRSLESTVRAAADEARKLLDR